MPDDVADNLFVLVNNIRFKLGDDSVESNSKYRLG